jgi:hypothetical protein
MTDPQFLFVAEYPCDKFCRVEVDLGEVDNLRFTYSQMQRRAEDEHKRLHRESHEDLTASFRSHAGR